ncbi:MAG: hypothetical protein EA362_11835 [Saprospirales bacterium]|nr:MAG: hypothetical protein EA362_11835 [Saprospirales bacterium]
MKTFVKLFAFSFLILGFYSCASSGEEGDKDNQNDVTSEISPEDAERRANMQLEWNISEIIDLWVNNLDERLTLTDDAKDGIRRVYSDAYTSSRGSLDDRIDRDQARELRQQLVRETENEIVELLTEDQANFYKRFYEDK